MTTNNKNNNKHIMLDNYQNGADDVARHCVIWKAATDVDGERLWCDST